MWSRLYSKPILWWLWGYTADFRGHSSISTALGGQTPLLPITFSCKGGMTRQWRRAHTLDVKICWYLLLFPSLRRSYHTWTSFISFISHLHCSLAQNVTIWRVVSLFKRGIKIEEIHRSRKKKYQTSLFQFEIVFSRCTYHY